MKLGNYTEYECKDCECWFDTLTPSKVKKCPFCDSKNIIIISNQPEVDK